MTIPVLWLTGPSGVGKTMLGRELYQRLGRAGIPAAHIDTNMIGICFPRSEGDPHGHALKAANLGALWPAFRDAGAKCLILAGGVETPEQVALYSSQIPDSEFTLVRLWLNREDHLARIYERNGKSVAWAEELVLEHEELDKSGIDEIVFNTGGRTVADAAEQILVAAGEWPVLE